MRTSLGTMGLGRTQTIIEIVTNQAHLDIVATKHLGLLYLLLRGGNGHENRALHIHMAAHIRHTLRMVSRTGANKMRFTCNLAHCIKSPAQFVRAYRA